MAYEHDPVTGRNMADRQDRIHVENKNRSSTPWILAAAVVAALVLLLWFFGGTGTQQPVNQPGAAPTTGGEVAPMGAAPGADGTAPAVDGGTAPGGATAPAAPGAAPAPVAPVD